VSVVAAHRYRNGKNVKAVSLDEPIDCEGKSEFVWIGLFEPSEQELEQLEKNYGLHPLAIEDALKANQMPKVVPVDTDVPGAVIWQTRATQRTTSVECYQNDPMAEEAQSERGKP
jgi:Mg2+ and Co2+ transporter CorA